jgi:purine-binding chemotaxis protein CheW
MRVLVFEVRGRPYALPADVIRHVDDVAEVTPLPFVPRYVDGLVALGGRVLPQIDLGALLMLPGETQGEGQLVVLAVGDTECALRVGATWRMLRVDETDIASVETLDDNGDLGLDGDGHRERLAGVFRYQDQSVFLLRPERIGLDGVAAGSFGQRSPSVVLGEMEVGDTAALRRAREEVISTLAVIVGGERYAFPLLRVLEVYVDRALTPLPDAPDCVAGISVLRGQPRLVISLARLLGVPADGAGASMVAATARGLPVVFRCDALLGIRRFPISRREATSEPAAGIDSFLIGADGTVTILLELDGLISESSFRRLRAFLPRIRDGADLSVLVPEKERRMLLVRMGSETCAIDIGRIERVANYSPPTGLPQAIGLRVGMTEIGGRVLPVADLGLAFGAALGDRAGAYVVVRTDRSDAFGLWALAVEAVERLVRVPEASILGASAHAGVSGGALSGRLLCGVGRVGNRLVNILDVNVLEDEEGGSEDAGATRELVAS